jgi:hypothetical protein
MQETAVACATGGAPSTAVRGVHRTLSPFDTHYGYEERQLVRQESCQAVGDATRSCATHWSVGTCTRAAFARHIRNGESQHGEKRRDGSLRHSDHRTVINRSPTQASQSRVPRVEQQTQNRDSRTGHTLSFPDLTRLGRGQTRKRDLPHRCHRPIRGLLGAIAPISWD